MRRRHLWFYLTFVILILDVRFSCAGVEKVVEVMLRKETVKPARTFTLKDCMRLAMTQNKDVLSAWHRIRETQLGDRLVTRSRLYPQLGFVWDYQKDHFAGTPTASATSNTDNSAVLNFSQRLFEFGKDASSEVALRQAERQALYSFENTVRSTLSSVREGFYTILLRQEQLKIRHQVLEQFREIYNRKKKRLEGKEPSIDPFDVLSAELSVLEEEANVNSLDADIAADNYALQQLMGEPIGEKINLEGEQDQTVFDVDAVVRTALENSPQLAQGREEIAEQQRVLREVMWEYFPDVSFGAGYQREDDQAGISIDSIGSDTWAADLTGDLHANRSNSRDDEFYRSGDTDFYVDLEVSVPIFEGFRRVGVYNQEKERLRQVELEVGKEREQIEQNVRRQYANMMQQARNVELARRSAAISKRRFEIQEKLKEEIPAMVDENQFETFRRGFFNAQDGFFSAQIQFVNARERLREMMGYFEEKPLDVTRNAGETT